MEVCGGLGVEPKRCHKIVKVGVMSGQDVAREAENAQHTVNKEIRRRVSHVQVISIFVPLMLLFGGPVLQRWTKEIKKEIPVGVCWG